uniref:Uncharacterized protein n=1 Tax=Heterorhabditis bacteriophora TaxID=37862 RepID=A0A1I7XDZ6_HETBA
MNLGVLTLNIQNGSFFIVLVSSYAHVQTKDRPDTLH